MMPKILISLFLLKTPGYAYASLHLIAAGSLLEFALAELPSFGVGRIKSVFTYPLSFYEFLEAKGEAKLLEFIKIGKTLESPFHKKLTEYLRIFLIIGSMPEVMSSRLTVNIPEVLKRAATRCQVLG